MSMTNFPGGITSFGVPVYGGAILPTFGNVFYLVTAKTSADTYYSVLRNAVEDRLIFATLAEAEDAMVTNQGDSLIVMPGNHLVTSEIAWDKNQTRIYAFGALNQRQQPETLTAGGVRFTCTTANVNYILNVTGSYVSMFGLGTMNNAADTDNLGDILVASRNFYAEGCSFRGGNNSTQNTSATSGIPLSIGAGYGARFVNCQIGQSGNATRTTGPGFVKFITGGHGGIDFINCDFQMRSETTGANVSGFLVQETSLDRLMRFKNCSFYNFSENWGALPDYLFNIDQTTTFDILLDAGCMMSGFDIVSDSARVKVLGATPSNAAVETTAVATS